MEDSAGVVGRRLHSGERLRTGMSEARCKIESEPRAVHDNVANAREQKKHEWSNALDAA